MRVLIDVDLDDDALARLRALPGVTVDLAHPIEEEARPLPVEQIREIDAIFCSALPSNAECMTSLRWVQAASVGIEHLVPWNLPARNVQVTNAQGVFDVPIGQWCIAMMINMARDLRGMIKNQRQGLWDRDRRFQTEIRGRTVGFWGYGGLARETARLAKAVGLMVHALAHRPIRRRDNVFCVPGTGDPEGLLPDRVFSSDDRLEFLRGLDFLILAMPLTSSTRGIVGVEELRALPPQALLLNPARGPLISEEALLTALKEGWIAGAALDAHHHYPLPAGHPLWALPNVIVTPHISGSSLSTFFQQRVSEIFYDNLQRQIRGEPLLNEIAPEQLTA